ncbi:MAG: hypothetical protein OQL27_01320 [Sedimenticola sp.]|nr:hypothetical protein [Sedimenticola sp.]
MKLHKPNCRAYLRILILIPAILFHNSLKSEERQPSEQIISTEKWLFAPEMGIEGMASIDNTEAARLEVECGNGGGPSITLTSPKVNRHSFNNATKVISFEITIDGHRFYESFQCRHKGVSCGTYGFPSVNVISAMRRGKQLTIGYDQSILATFTLAGSNRAMSKLSGCLDF